MRLTPYKKEKLHNINGFKKTEVHSIIDEFCESDLDCVKIEGWTHSCASSCMSSFSRAIIRYKKSGVRCLMRNGEVFLIKETKN